MNRDHWHVHSTLGNGYLCDCDSRYPLTAAGRDAALREERDAWRDYSAQGGTPLRITGSVRSGGYIIEDPASIAWARYVTSWTCSEAECLEGIEE